MVSNLNVYPGHEETVPLELAIPAGLVRGLTAVNKFGEATNCDSGVANHVWDRSNSVDDQPIWLAPTAPRVHAIVSSHASDDGDPGAGVVRVYGLQTWDSAETSELVTLNGTTPVNTVNSYVMINRMYVISGVGINVGYIKATAADDATVTAVILPGEGQTLMAIYGWGRERAFYLTELYASVLRSVASAIADFRLVYYYDVETVPTVFRTKHVMSAAQIGSTEVEETYNPYNRFEGPGILAVIATSSATDVKCTAGFDGILREE